MDHFSNGFVEILAAEQTPQSNAWFQGTADAVRKAARHFAEHEAEYYLILAGDHLYRMNYNDLLDAHRQQQADITIAAQPVDTDEATQMGIFRFDRRGQIVGFEEKPDHARLAEIGTSTPDESETHRTTAEQPFIASMGIYLFSRHVLLELLERESGVDFGRELIPLALSRYHVSAYLHRGYWADVGTVESFYDANIMLTRPDAPFSFYDPQRPIYTHARFLAPSLAIGCRLENTLVAEGSLLDRCEVHDSIVGIRTSIGAGARIHRSVLLGADVYESGDATAEASSDVPMGIGPDVELDRVIVDKNARIGAGARLVNVSGVQEADGHGYHIRSGIIIVPKGATIAPGTVV
jgi:glucose-1-phosphate adenylyltransferase